MVDLRSSSSGEKYDQAEHLAASLPLELRWRGGLMFEGGEERGVTV